MLKLHHTPSLFSSPAMSHKLQLSAVPDDDDELIAAIKRDRENEVWTLDKNPDVQQLDEFWAGVEADLKKDPDWFSFDNS